jgi:hypothetical protein
MTNNSYHNIPSVLHIKADRLFIKYDRERLKFLNEDGTNMVQVFK